MYRHALLKQPTTSSQQPMDTRPSFKCSVTSSGKPAQQSPFTYANDKDAVDTGSASLIPAFTARGGHGPPWQNAILVGIARSGTDTPRTATSPRPSDRTRNRWRRRTVQHRHHTATPVYDFSSIRGCNVQTRGRRGESEQCEPGRSARVCPRICGPVHSASERVWWAGVHHGQDVVVVRWVGRVIVGDLEQCPIRLRRGTCLVSSCEPFSPDNAFGAVAHDAGTNSRAEAVTMADVVELDRPDTNVGVLDRKETRHAQIQ